VRSTRSKITVDPETFFSKTIERILKQRVSGLMLCFLQILENVLAKNADK
jgi:hypothetical protein